MGMNFKFFFSKTMTFFNLGWHEWIKKRTFYKARMPWSTRTYFYLGFFTKFSITFACNFILPSPVRVCMSGLTLLRFFSARDVSYNKRICHFVGTCFGVRERIQKLFKGQLCACHSATRTSRGWPVLLHGATKFSSRVMPCVQDRARRKTQCRFV